MRTRAVAAVMLALSMLAVVTTAEPATPSGQTVHPAHWTTLNDADTDLVGIVMPSGAIATVHRDGGSSRIVVDLGSDARLVVTMQEPAESASLQFLDDNGAPQPLRDSHREALEQMLTAIGVDPVAVTSPLAAPLMRLLDWLAEAPPDYVLDLRIDNARYRSLCKSIGRAVTAHWDFTGGSDSTSTTLGPCGEGRCFGRCGQGCGGSPGPERVFQQFTQDCLNHDACVESLGYAAPGCQDEFSATADDVLNAPDCNAVEGTWQVTYTTNPSVQTRTLEFSMIDETFLGTAHVEQGRYTTIQGSRGAPPALASTSVKIPLWKNTEACNFEPMGFATAKLKGTNYCGVMRARLVKGRWPGFNTSTCEVTTIYPWTGKLTAKRTKW